MKIGEERSEMRACSIIDNIDSVTLKRVINRGTDCAWTSILPLMSARELFPIPLRSLYYLWLDQLE